MFGAEAADLKLGPSQTDKSWAVEHLWTETHVTYSLNSTTVVFVLHCVVAVVALTAL